MKSCVGRYFQNISQITLLATAVSVGLYGETQKPTCATDILRKVVKDNNFKRGRSLESYERILGASFSTPFFNSQTTRRPIHWLDLGAGNMIAAREAAGDLRITETIKPLARHFRYGTDKTRPNVTAVSYKIDAGVSDFNKKTTHGQYYVGKFFEDISNRDLAQRFGRVDFGTDIFGVIAYTDRPTVVLEKLHDVLKDYGTMLVFLGPRDFIRENGRKSSSLWGSHVELKNRKVVPYPIWLRDEVKGFKSELLYNKDGSSQLIMTRLPRTPFRANTLVPTRILADDTLPYHRVFHEE